MDEIYIPSEDSYLMAETIKKLLVDKFNKSNNKQFKVLDMGSGSGIQAQTIINLGVSPKNITLIDINTKAVKLLIKQFPKSNVIESDLFQNISLNEKFGLIVFNPPYLPENKYDNKKDTTGGKKGSEVITKFLKQAKNYLSKQGEILLLTSSHTKKINWNGYSKKLLASKKLFYEEIYVHLLS